MAIPDVLHERLTDALGHTAAPLALHGPFVNTTTRATIGAREFAKLHGGLQIESMLYGTKGIRDISRAIAAQAVWRTL